MVHLVDPPATNDDPAVELAVSLALLRQVSSGTVDDTIRIHRPSSPVVAFGRRDTRRPGFGDAVRHARDAGFEPLVRSVGGRAVAYTESALVIDIVRREIDPVQGMHGRFVQLGEAYAGALRGLGVDARVGAVPGEYCPGAQSVNARGTIKLVGTAQRTVRDAWLFSALVVVSGDEIVRPLLREVYDSLGLDLDPESIGSVIGERPSVDQDEVVRATIAATTHGLQIERGALEAATWDLAHELAAGHRVQA